MDHGIADRCGSSAGARDGAASRDVQRSSTAYAVGSRKNVTSSAETDPPITPAARGWYSAPPLPSPNTSGNTPVIVVKSEDHHAHVYLSGRTSRTLDGAVACVGDMRGQIGEVCKAIQIALETVGATMADITRTISFTTDMKAYFAAID